VASVLIVDDDRQVLDLLANFLTKSGYRVRLAHDGYQALDCMRQERADLCLTDLVMPEREGVETIQEIRREFPATKIIAMSGAAGGSYLRVAELLGAHAILPKPFELQRLLDTIRSLLGEPAQNP
jgi:DNA-binding response OmpR family regulator